MSEISTLFFDLGGVLLTNGWDRNSRRQCVESFGLDYEEFRDRHELVADAFETGRLTMDEYMARTVFYRERDFTSEAFRKAMLDESRPYPDALGVLADLAATGKYLLATLNNESRELNEARIEKFQLGDHFQLFLSSGFLGVKKPDRAIYRLALQLTQRRPEECVFVDDRDVNLACAVTEGMHTIHYENAGQLRKELIALGIEIEE